MKTNINVKTREELEPVKFHEIIIMLMKLINSMIIILIKMHKNQVISPAEI